MSASSKGSNVVGSQGGSKTGASLPTLAAIRKAVEVAAAKVAPSSETAVQRQPEEPDYDDTPLIGWMVHPRNERLVATLADERFADATSPDAARLIASAPDLLAERDRLQAEVETLRTYLDNQLAEETRQRLRAIKAEGLRDALANALESEVAARRWRPISEWDQAPVGRLQELGEEQDGIVWSREITSRFVGTQLHHSLTHFRECLHGDPEGALAALRAAGRLK
jgi:hypothetical protein